jgi:hypothetical protein
MVASANRLKTPKHRSSVRSQLLNVNLNASDRTIAMLIAEMMLESDALPYKFSINHDIRPPACKACALHYDWALKDTVGITTTDKLVARRWITHACLLGYRVTQENGQNPLSSSIEIARQRAARHQAPKDETDDDIPF